jgi:hypothetical protein
MADIGCALDLPVNEVVVLHSDCADDDEIVGRYRINTN